MQVTPAIHALRHSFKIPVAPGITLDHVVEPREGETAYGQIKRGRICLQKIHSAVIFATGSGDPEPMELAGKAAGDLGLSPRAISPLLA